MSVLDSLILLAYFTLALGIGFWAKKRAAGDLTNYLVADRNLPGWLIGTSMVATTFAADTPLAVTGLVAEHGVAGNWLWWSLAFGHILAALVFAPFWRRAEVITDAEFVELRYSGRSATVLRALRAFYFAIPINCIIMAWVIRAMGKIVAVLFPWQEWLPEKFYAQLENAWPQSWAISSPSEGLSILIGVTIATLYAALGGLPGVIFTDLAQFILATVGAIAFAIFAVQHVGGLTPLVQQLEGLYGTATTQNLLSPLPSLDNSSWLPLNVFLVYVLVQWWAHKFSDGGGILVQRMSAARNAREALKGTAWFTIAHYAVRPWPWILVGLVALILYPLNQNGDTSLAQSVAADREMAYPVLMLQLLPSGWLGVVLASMAAAFMSTIDTHVTWGASYFTRDVYQRFVDPHASPKKLIALSRLAMVGMALLAVGFSTQVHSIAGAWKFLVAMGAGLGLVSILRWFWWRINAWSEIAGMLSASLCALWLYAQSEPPPFHIALLWVAGISTSSVFIATWLTPAVSPKHLQRFVDKIQPIGAWNGLQPAQPNEDIKLSRRLALCVVAAVGLFAVLFGVGEVLLGNTLIGWGLCASGLGAWVVVLLRLQDKRTQTKTPHSKVVAPLA